MPKGSYGDNMKPYQSLYVHCTYMLCIYCTFRVYVQHIYSRYNLIQPSVRRNNEYALTTTFDEHPKIIHSFAHMAHTHIFIWANVHAATLEWTNENRGHRRQPAFIRTHFLTSHPHIFHNYLCILCASRWYVLAVCCAHSILRIIVWVACECVHESAFKPSNANLRRKKLCEEVWEK